MMMRRSNPPFHEREYGYDDKRGCFFPILEAELGPEGYRSRLQVLADTGCTSCMALLKSFVEKENLTLGTKMNKNPIPVLVADGHTINADEYEAVCRIGGIERQVVVTVMDPEKYFEEPTVGDVIPLLGRGFLDHYDVLFKGKDRRICLFHPESQTEQL
jgi:predicted aspartyl protease